MRFTEGIVGDVLHAVYAGFERFRSPAAEALAKAGHTVFASMRETAGHNAPQVKKIAEFSEKNGVDLRAVELAVQSEQSVSAGVAKVLAVGQYEQGRKN